MTGDGVTSVAELGSVWSDWALSRATALELAAEYHRTSPSVVVEAGSGWSTVIAAEYAARTGATVVSLEHERPYAAATRCRLAERGLAGVVDVRCVPLVDIDTPRGPAPWYDTPLPDGIEFALVDGPPGSVGRQGAMYALRPHLADSGWRVWLDDTNRSPEQEAVAAWREDLCPLHTRMIALPHGVTVISDTPPDDVDASDIIITVLTGRRPKLLADTLEHLYASAPGLLESATVIVHHNDHGNDQQTTDVIDASPYVDQLIVPDRPLSLGESMSSLAPMVAESGATYWLHLEDDWRATTTVPAGRWLADARRCLDVTNGSGSRAIGQVRLRHRSEATRTVNMATRAASPWHRLTRGSSADHPGIPYVSGSHYTCNPSLMLAADAHLAWPARGENTASARYAASGMLAAQLDPGVFVHTGGSQSLERPAGRRRMARPARRR